MQQRTDEPFDPVYADARASYVQEYRIDVSKLEPLVAAPHSPDNRKLARECASTKIDRVYIGCAIFCAEAAARAAMASTSVPILHFCASGVPRDIPF